MVLISRSPTGRVNIKLAEHKPKKDVGNVEWVRGLDSPDGVILIGGSSVADFRIRVAQSALRHDMHPSHWSLCGITLSDKEFASVPLSFADVSAVAPCNGIRTCRLADYDDPQRFPNIAVIRFAKFHDTVHRDIERLKADRSILDLPALMLPWLGFVWGAKGATNPLLGGTGLPSAAFVETVFAMAGFELTPGLSSASSCPEAMWQAAKWWSDFYASTVPESPPSAGKGKRKERKAESKSGAGKSEPLSVSMVPVGAYLIRQPFAAILE